MEQGGTLGQEVGGSEGDRAVQCADRGGGRAQDGDLPGHEHALGELAFRWDRQQLTVRVPFEPFAGDPQPADVEPLQLLPHPPVGDAPRPQPLLDGAVPVGERAGHAPGGMARSGLQQDSAPRGHHLVLEQRLDGAALHRLLGEQVRGAHQQADGSAAPDERGAEPCRHGGRTFVVDATGEQDLDPVRRVTGAVQEVLDDPQLGLPERKAAERPDMAAAFGAFEHEPAGTGLKELAEQPRRGDVQKGGDPLAFQRLGLGWPPARDDHMARAQFAYRFELVAPELGRRESEDADAPRPSRQRGLARCQHLARPVPPRQGERDEGQSALLGDGAGEFRLVADPGHRPLRHRQPGSEGAAHRCPWAQRRRCRPVPHGLLDGLGHGSYRRGGIAPTLSEPAGEEAVLAHREQSGAQVVHAEPRGDTGGRFGTAPGSGRFGTAPGAGAAAQHPVTADDDGLRTVHGADRGRRLVRQAGLGEQRQLGVQHDPGRPAEHRPSRRARPDPAAGPHGDGHRGLGKQELEQDERAELPDPATALAAPGYQAVRPGASGVHGLVQVGHLNQHPVAVRDFTRPPGRVHAEHHGAEN